MNNIGSILLIFGAVALLFSAALGLSTIVFWIAAAMLIIGGIFLLEETEFGGKLLHGLLMLTIGALVSYGLTWIGCCF